MDDKLARLIWLQAGAEARELGLSFAKLTQEERVRYIRDQHQRLVVTLCDALSEVDWKPRSETQLPRVIHRDHYVTELLDALGLWINLVLAVSGDATPREVADEIFTRFALQKRAAAGTEQQLESEEKSK